MVQYLHFRILKFPLTGANNVLFFNGLDSWVYIYGYMGFTKHDRGFHGDLTWI
jgi:hypothetical protein